MKQKQIRVGEEQRPAIREWMQAVLDTTGWSAAKWARNAVTSASNITRFLANDHAAMPTWQTMAKLASVSPIPPPPIGPHPGGMSALARQIVGILEQIEPPRQPDFVQTVKNMADLMGGAKPEDPAPDMIPPAKPKKGRA